LLLFVHQRLAELSRDASRQKQEPGAVLLQGRKIDPGLVVEAFQVRERRETRKIPVSLLVLSQQSKVVEPTRPVWSALHSFRGHVNLTPDDWLYPLLLCFLDEPNRAG